MGTKPARLKSHCSICAQGSFVCITSQQKAFLFSLIKLSRHQPWICQNLIKLTEHAFYGRFSIKPAQTDWLTLFLRAVDALLAWYIINNKQRAVFFLAPAMATTRLTALASKSLISMVQFSAGWFKFHALLHLELFMSCVHPSSQSYHTKQSRQSVFYGKHGLSAWNRTKVQQY